jgi:heat shock protein HslJ
MIERSIRPPFLAATLVAVLVCAGLCVPAVTRGDREVMTPPDRAGEIPVRSAAQRDGFGRAALDPVVAPSAGGSPGLGITPEQVSLSLGDLPGPYRVSRVAQTPYDASQPSGPVGLPEHLEITFGPMRIAGLLPGDPILYLLPVDAYRAQWEAAGDGAVTQAIEQIYLATVALPAPLPTAGLPALPPEQTGGANDAAAWIDRVAGVSEHSAARDGYRFLGRWAQDANPIVNGDLRYVYQGFTNDGKYLISFWYPVTTPALADTVADFPEAELQLFYSDPQAYIAAQVAVLNQLAPADFEPSLASLDALVASLRIAGMPADGLTGFVWRPVVQADARGMTPEAVDAPLRYRVSYFPSGRLSYVADCGPGGGTFILDGAVTGRIGTQLDPAPLPSCGPDSLSREFVRALARAQEFRVLPGGTSLQLNLPDGGAAVGFELVGPAEELPPGPQPTVVLPTPAPMIPIGRVMGIPGVNVRAGPGSAHPLVGFAPSGMACQVIGRSADRQWWAWALPSSPTGLGWISAAYVLVNGAEYVPIIMAPPPPAASATPTRVPLATAGAPGHELAFWADRTQIAQGECVRLLWRSPDALAVRVYAQGQPSQDLPQQGEGSQEVCPQSTTTYALFVELQEGGAVLRQVTIRVIPALPAAASPTRVPPTATATPTRVPPTATATRTRVPPTATATPTRVPPTATATRTRVPPTATATPTRVPPTATATRTRVPPTATATRTRVLPTATPGSPLADTGWAVSRFERFGVPVGGVQPTVRLSRDGQAEFFGGCNTLKGTYLVAGDRITFRIRTGTILLCGEEVDAQEGHYLLLLSLSHEFELAADELVLRDDDGDELLRFDRK